MRPILPLLVFLMLAPAARAEGVLLTRAGRTETLRVAPQTLGNRSSWDGDPASLTFAFDATGRDGVYGLTVSLSGGRATSVILWLPEGRYLLPGVVTHRTTAMEHPEVVADRIIRYAQIVGRENVIASTDCGFAQGALYQRVHPSIQWAKLERLVQGAQLASKVLWRR